MCVKSVSKDLLLILGYFLGSQADKAYQIANEKTRDKILLSFYFAIFGQPKTLIEEEIKTNPWQVVASLH